MKRDLYILNSIYDQLKLPKDADCIMMNELAKLATSFEFRKHLFRYRAVVFLSPRMGMIQVPFLVAGVCRLLTFGKCEWICDDEKKRITCLSLIGLGVQWLKDQINKSKEVRRIGDEINVLQKVKAPKGRKKNNAFAYIRTDPPCHLNAGGSVGHIAGVLNNLSFLSDIIFISTEKVPTVNNDITYRELDYWVDNPNIQGFINIQYNSLCYKQLENYLSNKNIALIYHRYSMESYAVAKYSLLHGIPYVLEYNGSELWILKNWTDGSLAGRLPFADLSYGIEKLVVEKAALITCVSSPLKDQLLGMGIPDERILVNYNGVDTEKYSPDLDGEKIRKKYGIGKDIIVIGFIGTFGAWHGAERLAEAYADLSYEYNNIHLLMIGDGLRMPQVKTTLESMDCSRFTLPGMVPQEEGPDYLAACDILVNPTLPNEDGSPFFGSPTKLFEYMAMGKAIVASNMDQMSEVLDDKENAILIKPGDVDAIKEALIKLINDNDLRSILGSKAREKVCEKYTWKKHVERILKKYDELYCE